METFCIAPPLAQRPLHATVSRQELGRLTGPAPPQGIRAGHAPHARLKLGFALMEPVIGIDLGTTYSAVATVENGRPISIHTRSGGRLMPSILGFTALGERVAGERARLLGDDAPDRVAFAT